jgi:hypothetical protein
VDRKEPLIDVWRRQFLSELDQKIAAAQLSVDSTEPGGWFQGQLKQAVEMYRAARKAAESREST